MTLGKLLNFSVPYFLHLPNRNNDDDDDVVDDDYKQYPLHRVAAGIKSDKTCEELRTRDKGQHSSFSETNILSVNLMITT